ncbi:MAG: threonine synthase, partial [Clostridia bacterium]|nr:threonine synthase [Clostridia bacterium]
LYMPETIPAIGPEFIKLLSGLDYKSSAVEILSLFLTDYTPEELRAAADAAYSEDRFPGGAAPVRKISDDLFSLELWHGPTCAFKDMALQIMPKLLSTALGKTGTSGNLMILVATSGDTGKAALEGYRDSDRIKILVYYPSEGVSRVQKLQMITQMGSNTAVTAIRGNFDDAQTGVKKLFSDRVFSEKLASLGYRTSSANSINWGRLVPQIVYYFSAYCDLMNTGAIKLGDMIDFAVPTGNFGDIFAAYIAKKMGLPVERLICASNRNNVLTDFINTGVYDRNREFFLTSSPSMDILISSNLERLIYLLAGPAQTSRLMSKLSSEGRYTVPDELLAAVRESFDGDFATENETAETVARLFDSAGYLCDPHTAVAMKCALARRPSGRPCVVVSTASPYKFASSVYTALRGPGAPSGYAALSALSDLTKTEIPLPLRNLDKAEIRFPDVCEPSEMADACLRFAAGG